MGFFSNLFNFNKKNDVGASSQENTIEKQIDLILNLTMSILERSIAYKLGNETDFKILEDEKIFFTEVVKQVIDANLDPKYLHFYPMSIKDFSVYYADYPIGRIKLRGRKTNMLVLKGLHTIKNYENLTLEDYISYIPDWIKYIKYCLKN